MVHKGYKSNAAAELLRKETNVHFFNPNTNKIDLKMFTKHLCEKDEYANDELDNYFVDYSSYSDNELLKYMHSSDSFSSADEKSDNQCDKSKKKRRRNPVSTSVSVFKGRRIKTKQRYSSWFLMYVENPNTSDINWLKDFRRRFRLPYYKYKELLHILKEHPLFSHW